MDYENNYEMDEELESTELVEVTDEPIEEADGIGFLGKLLIGLGVAGAVGGIAYGVTHREQIKQKRAEKKKAWLEKMGYVVTAPGEYEEVDSVDADYEEVEDAE